LSAGISLVSAFLGKWRDVENTGMYFKIQQILADKMLEMDFANADDTKTHELLSTIRQNQNGGGWGLMPVIGCYEGFVSDLMKLTGGVALTVSLFLQPVPESAGALTALNNPLFVLLVIAVLLAVTYLSPALSNKAGSYYALHADSHNLGNRLFSFFGFLGYRRQLAADVRIYRQELLCEKYNNNKYDTFNSKGMFARFAKGPMGLCSAASAAVSMVFIGCVYVFVCLKSWAGAFGVGNVTQYIGAITLLSGSVSALISTAGRMRNNAPFVRLIFDFLELPDRMDTGSLPVKKGKCSDYEIEFRNVSFRYPGSENYSLRDVSMKFHPGERLAVVGENGSGKTTFIKLLCRLYDPTEGEILLNGIDIREYDYAGYMGIFSVVFQDFSLYAFTLGQNVGTRVAYDRALAQECLEKAGFGERLAGMEQGTETYLYKEFSKEGVDISGGEAQKIALARSLYRDVPFIVLDEPTAALDPIAEAEVYGKFNEIVGDKTAVYISHRLSSCRFCSDIAVFHEGRLVQRGSHEQLAADKNGKYYELWNAQAQYYAEKK
ncbi:MAG: ABC transporter ATP-binding protein, partial [Lachnospiraceae bacterium]|nr:ABC transporter ATP-binding protein [Lachnospiraceae bacterium]